MSIEFSDLSLLVSSLNDSFRNNNLSFKMSKHFIQDRLNHPRNRPTISLTEIHLIFNRLTSLYLQDLLRLKHKDNFCIKCQKSHINIPCSVKLTSESNGDEHREIIAITIMRKKDFMPKDDLIFTV